MPNTREKLEVMAHLGDHITYKEDIGICYDSALAKVIEDTYMELKNGVTVQECADLKESLEQAQKEKERWKISAIYYHEKCATAQEWISVKDRLPENDSDVLAYLRIGEEGRIYPANYAKGMWFDCIFNTPATESTTHWMPLPPPPKGE